MKPKAPAASPFAVGMQWASRISTIGIEFVAPAVAGSWLDGKVGSTPWLTIAGCFVGMGLGFYEILRIARETSRSNSS